MHAVIARYHWLTFAAAVLACALFAARLVNHLVAGELLADAPHGPAVTRAATTSTAPRAARDGQALIDRNMFCSECAPPSDGPAPPPPPAGDPSAIPYTALPLRLVATHVADGRHAARDSLAFVVDTASARQGAYAIGQRLRGAGPIVAIAHQHVDFHNDATGRDERLALDPSAQAAAATPAPAPAADRTAEVEGIRALDGTSFEVDRALIARAIANPMAFARDARIVPSTGKDGTPDGFKVVSVRPGSAVAGLGLTRGDTIRAINGITLDSMDQVMSAFGKLQGARDLQLDLTRGGQPVSLRYQLR